MIRVKKTIISIITFFYFSHIAYANTLYFKEGVEFFNKKEFEKAKFKFEQDLVLNPKSENSYLYLSKIFKLKKDDNQEEKNLKTVILLNPKNEEAIYNLAKLKLDNSDYKKSKELNERLIGLCINFCNKSQTLKIEIENLSKK